MTDRDRAAINVEQLIRDMELITAVQQLGGKGLVQFPQADVVHLQIESLEESRNSEHGPDAHFIGLGSRHCHADIAAERRETTPFRSLSFHHDASRCSIRQLARIARSHNAAFHDGLERSLVFELRLEERRGGKEAVSTCRCGCLCYT